MSLQDHHNMYWSIYSQDNPETTSRGWIQWKGTDVCIDLHCDCGHHCHFDGGFFYYFECPKCKAVFAVGQNVKLIKLNESQIKHAAEMVQTCHLDDQQ